MSEISLSIFIYWLVILCTFMVAGFVVYFANRYFWQDSMKLVEEATRNLRLAYENLGDLNRFLTKFTPDDPEPYGSRCSTLSNYIARASDHIREIDLQIQDIQAEINSQTEATTSQILKSPIFWYRVRRRLVEQVSKFDSVNDALSHADFIKSGIEGLGWEAAHLARQTRQHMEQAKHTLFEIHIMNIEGQPLEDAKSLFLDCEQELNLIPDLFFAGNKSEIHRYADKKQVVDVFDTNQKIDRILDDLEAKFSQWKQDYIHIQKKITEMQQNIGALELTLARMPGTVSLESQILEYEQLSVTAQNLEANTTRLDIQQFDESSESAARIISRAKELDLQLNHTRQQYLELVDLLDELGPTLETENRIFAGLTADPIHPLDLGTTQQNMDKLTQMLVGIGPVERNRDPVHVKHDLEVAKKLENNLQKVTPYRARLQEDHRELVSLVTLPEIAEFPGWNERTMKVCQGISEYAPENWARVDRVTSFPADIEELQERYRKLIPESFPEPIPESILSSHLNYVQNLVNDCKLMLARADSICDRFEKIKEIEQACSERLEHIRAAFNQMRYVINSNEFLSDLAGPESERLLLELQRVSDDLAQPLIGEIEEKSNSISSINARILSRSAAWLDRLVSELTSLVLQITEILATFNQIADIQESAVDEAHKVALADSEISSLLPEDPGQNSLLDLAQRLKRSSEYWHACGATLRALEDVAIPIFESYSKAESNYQAAHQQYKKTSALISGKRRWPPASVSIEREKLELEQLDRQWWEFRKEPIRAISLVSQFGLLSARYQTLAERIGSQMERIIQDKHRVQELEDELAALISKWNEQRKLQRGNANVIRGIRELLDDTNKNLNQLIRQSKKGEVDYPTALDSLRELILQLRQAQVMIDETRSINIDRR
jgi:hypothetical protein